MQTHFVPKTSKNSFQIYFRGMTKCWWVKAQASEDSITHEKLLLTFRTKNRKYSWEKQSLTRVSTHLRFVLDIVLFFLLSLSPITSKEKITGREKLLSFEQSFRALNEALLHGDITNGEMNRPVTRHKIDVFQNKK